MKRFLIIMGNMLLAISLLTACGSKNNNIGNLTTSNGNTYSEESTTEEFETDYVMNNKSMSSYIQMQNAVFQYPASNDEWKYNVYDCYIEITDYIGEETSMLIFPNEIDGLPVWAINKMNKDDGIGESWRTAPLKEVILPNNLLVIGEGAFREAGIETITFPDSLISIGESAFYDNSLKNIELPDSLEIIEAYAFCNAIGQDIIIEELNIPESVKSIGVAAFAIVKMNQVNIPQSVESIGHEAFNDCNFTRWEEGENYEETYEKIRIDHDFDIYIYNPNVVINGDIGKGTIHGYAGSTAAQYCAEKNREFVLIK